MKIVSIVGARPQFIKVAPIVKEITRRNKEAHHFDHVIIHTGQHYDFRMNKIFFDELNIPKPDYNLDVGSASHAVQTAAILKATEAALQKEKPDFVIVYGDTNSTLGGALAAAKLHFTLVHVEAGLRSFNLLMPEEINRRLTDHCANILFCPTKAAVSNLMREGISSFNNGLYYEPENEMTTDIRVKGQLAVNVGDVMYDALLLGNEIAEKNSTILNDLSLSPQEYYLATVHRAENTDNLKRLSSILKALKFISEKKPVIFPAHLRTRRILDKHFNYALKLQNLRIIDPLGYFDMLKLESNAIKILTDSGGLQKESFLQKVPCVTLRDESEWVETLENGWNILAGACEDKIISVFYASQPTADQKSHFGLGDASRRMLKFLEKTIIEH